ncbi:MAG TPA: pyridoxamine 5'-phosphate oxidase family protein [Lachnospiraceae bacterium]
MFRKMRRFKQELDKETCEKILKEEPRGVLAVLGDEGYPYTVPLDYIYEDGKIYFHGAKVGHKMDAIKKCDKVSFCVYDKGFKKEGDWALNISSVVVFGRIKEIEDREMVFRRVKNLGLKYYPTPESVDEEMKRSAAAVACLELTIEHMTGKIINEK